LTTIHPHHTDRVAGRHPEAGAPRSLAAWARTYPSLARSRCRVSFRCRGTPRGGAAAPRPTCLPTRAKRFLRCVGTGGCLWQRRRARGSGGGRALCLSRSDAPSPRGGPRTGTGRTLPSPSSPLAFRPLPRRAPQISACPETCAHVVFVSLIDRLMGFPGSH
jgi:hypothetical protein